MKILKTLLIITSVSFLAGCQTNASKLTTAQCAGWGKITMKPTTASYLTKEDRDLANSIVSHNRFGTHKGCW